MNGAQRTFFRRIKKAIVSNPFSAERALVDRKLVGISDDQPVSDEQFENLLVRLNTTLADLRKKSRTGKARFDSDDQQLIGYGVVFDLFHSQRPYFDALINEQITKGEVSCSVPFASEIIRRLVSVDFSEAEAMRILALFYQMRRAFYFISSIKGESDCVQRLRKSLWNNIFTENIELYESYLWNRMEDFSTMLLGETGTGKGMAASAIGRSGFIPFDLRKQCFQESFAKTFISINLSQFPEQLIESELFGHQKGAFTGAIDTHQGIFSRCSPFGAIFIDEIGEVVIPVQIKLLHVLQERQFSPVGSHHVEKFQGRVIGATNQPLAELMEKGRFREDFYYRLCSDVIEVPPLRLRISENPKELYMLLSFIVERIVGRSSPELVESIGTHISANQPEHYGWPGNIRELEQCVRQVLLNGRYKWPPAAGSESTKLADGIEQGTFSASQLLGTYCRALYAKLGTYEAVAKVIKLDRRTVKKYIVNTTTDS